MRTIFLSKLNLCFDPPDKTEMTSLSARHQPTQEHISCLKGFHIIILSEDSDQETPSFEDRYGRINGNIY